MLTANVSGIEFKSNGDGTCTFVGRGTCTDAEIIFPTKSPAGDTLTKLMGGRFFGDEVLTAVYIPETVIDISVDFVAVCPTIAYINVSEDNTVYSSVGGVLYNKDITTLILYPEAKTAEDFEIPASVTTIGIGAFVGAENLKSISVPESVTRIYERAFLSCICLESVVIPDGVKTIYKSSFQNCPALASVTIPASVEKIDESAFAECKALSSIVFKGTKSQWESVKTKGNWRALVPAKGVTCSDGTEEFSFVYS